MTNDPLFDDGVDEAVHALVRAVRKVGASAVAEWSTRCGWCSSGLVCAGDPYVCSYITAEVECELLDGTR